MLPRCQDVITEGGRVTSRGWTQVKDDGSEFASELQYLTANRFVEPEALAGDQIEMGSHLREQTLPLRLDDDSERSGEGVVPLVQVASSGEVIDQHAQAHLQCKGDRCLFAGMQLGMHRQRVGRLANLHPCQRRHVRDVEATAFSRSDLLRHHGRNQHPSVQRGQQVKQTTAMQTEGEVSATTISGTHELQRQVIRSAVVLRDVGGPQVLRELHATDTRQRTCLDMGQPTSGVETDGRR